MRKFRVYDKTCDLMVYNVQDIYDCQYRPEYGITEEQWWKTDLSSLTHFGQILHEPNLILMETLRGMVDLDGKDIYDGDILKGAGAAYGVVAFMQDIETSVPWAYVEGIMIDMYQGMPENFRVVGNVWQNPEMIGGIKKDSPLIPALPVVELKLERGGKNTE